MSKFLYMETDGDRYPKDVYLVNEEGLRVAMEGHNELTMRRLALEICKAFNTASVSGTKPVDSKPVVGESPSTESDKR